MNISFPQVSRCAATFLVLSLLVLFSVDLNGQGLSIRGDLTDNTTLEPVSEVEVLLYQIRADGSEQLLGRYYSDESGRFRIPVLFNFPVKLELRHEQYYDETVELGNYPNQVLNISLHRKEPVHIQGIVVNDLNNRSIPDASVELIEQPGLDPDQTIGTVTDENGRFELRFTYTLPLTIRITHLTYETKEVQIEESRDVDLEVRLLPRIIEGEDIIIVSDMVTRDELQQTRTTAGIRSVDIERAASFDAFDLVSAIREVDVATQSMNFHSVSTRGFNTGANPRFMQMTDGADQVAPGLGFPVGNLLGPPDIDIQSMDLMIGPSSAEFGSGAMGGALNIQSKNPFDVIGFSMETRGGVSGFTFGGSEAFEMHGSGIVEVSGRYAESFNDRFAIKLTGTWMEGLDWRAENYRNIGRGETWERHPTSPGYNGVNVYGDESYVFLQVGEDDFGIANDTWVPVTRTGYREEDLVDYRVATRKIAGSAHYRITPSLEWSVEGRYGFTHSLYTADSRIRLEDFEMIQLRSALHSDNFYLRAYTNRQYSGNSYDVVQLSNALLNSAKEDAYWFRDFSIAYTEGVSFLGVRRGSHEQARIFADSPATMSTERTARGRYEPGTEAFDEEVSRLRSIYDLEEGAGIRDNSVLYNAETGYRFPDVTDRLSLDTGAEFRFYDLDSEGTIFPDTTGNDITNYQGGIFARGEMALMEDDLMVTGGLRLDKSENFSAGLSPQFGLSMALRDVHFLRFTYQYGFRFPTVREQFINQKVGNRQLLGGLTEITSGFDLHENAFTEDAVNRFNEAVHRELDPDPDDPGPIYTREQAELKHLSILDDGVLQAGEMGRIKPEKTHAFEVGYRRLFTPEIYIDLNYFVSFYRDFIGITRLVKPRTSPAVDLYTSAGQINSALESDRFHVFSNSDEWMTVQGLSFDFKYHTEGFFTGVNGTWSHLMQDPDDPLTPGFNTAPFMANLEWGNPRLIGDLGFKVITRFRSAHDWESPFLDGRIRTHMHADIQVNYRLPKLRSIIKTGFSNIGHAEHYNVFGGPMIGTIIFASFTYNPSIF